MNDPLPGDVRVISHGSPVNTSVEVMTEQGVWQPLRAVSKVQLTIEACEPVQAVLRVWPVEAHFTAPSDAVVLERYAQKAE